jgi:PAS domain S-box-containing protein
VAEVFPEVIEQGFIGLLDGVYASGKPFIGKQTPAMLYDPTTNRPEQRYVDFIYQPLFSEQGETQGILAFIVDVTEKVLAQRKVEESEQRFRNLADNMTPLAWMADEQGWIYWYNKRWYEYTGSDFEQMQGWGWEKVHHSAYIDRVVEFVKKAWKKNQAWELEFPLRKYDGTYGWFLTRAVPLVDERGKITGWFGTNTDISEQKRVQQQLQTLNEELASTTEELRAANEEIQAANEELSLANDQLLRTNVDLDNFIYTASHDLKAPISNIEALLTALLRTLPSECLKAERTGHITTLMKESIERFKRTIANLTEVIKLQKENNSEMVLVDLSKVIGEVSLDLQPLILQTNAQIEINVKDCPKVRFSEKNLRSVIYNLLSNAIKYHSPGHLPQVSISCQATAAYHVLIVTDNGLGIESGRISQLFTMFKRFHDHVEGTGIGLYMVKKMVENAGGKIEVESRLAEGSTFRVYFPL